MGEETCNRSVSWWILIDISQVDVFFATEAWNPLFMVAPVPGTYIVALTSNQYLPDAPYSEAFNGILWIPPSILRIPSFPLPVCEAGVIFYPDSLTSNYDDSSPGNLVSTSLERSHTSALFSIISLIPINLPLVSSPSPKQTAVTGFSYIKHLALSRRRNPYICSVGESNVCRAKGTWAKHLHQCEEKRLLWTKKTQPLMSFE